MKRLFLIYLTLCIILPMFKTVSADTETEIYYTNSEYYSESGGWYNSELLGHEGTKSRYSNGNSSFAKWSIPLCKNGYYRVLFYNLTYTNNSKNVKILCDGTESILNHNGTNELSGFEELGIFEKRAGDDIDIVVSCNSGQGFYRTNSVKLEYYPFAEEFVYKTESLKKISGTWNASSLLGYDNTDSVYAVGNAICRWEIKHKGITDLYFHNIVTDGNCPTAYISVYNSKGIICSKEIPHKLGDGGQVYLGRYEFFGDGSEYVEISNPANGYLRINSLRARFYHEALKENDEIDYSRRVLTERAADIAKENINAEKIYVKPGSVNGNGTIEKPFATVYEAKEKVRELIKGGYPKAGITVNLSDGIYLLDSVLNFESSDSGTKDNPVIWQALGDGAEFMTSQIINKSEFTKVTDNDILKRIPKSAADKIYSVELGESTDTSSMSISSPYMVVFDDTAGNLAKWPNDGFDRTGDLADIGTRSDSGPKQRGFTYIIDNSRIFNWANEKNGWLGGYWMTPYTMDFVKISAIDNGKMTVTGQNGTSLGAYDNGRYTALNMMCELDSEGEWYIEDGVLYVVMPKECERVYISYTDTGIIKFAGAHDIAFKGIDFKNCSGTAVTFNSSSQRCGVIGAEIKNTTGNGAVINGKDCYIRDCDISYVGGIGIQIYGGDQYKLIHGGNWAENNTVTKTGRCSTSKAGISIGGCGNRVSNNHIYDVPTHGVNGSGMENIIEKNIVERTNLEMGDTGGIYFLNYGMGYGSKIRYNIVKDSVGLNKTEGFANEGALGIYLDDLTSGVEVFGNIIYHSKEPALFGHGGRNLSFKNNVIIDCDESIRVVKTSIAKNLDIENGVAAVNIRKYNTPEINAKYPEAVGALSDEYGEPKYNTVVNNVIFNSFEPEINSVVNNGGTVSGNLYYKDKPKTACTDFYDLDFSEIVNENAEFIPIPVSEIGTYKGGMRNGTEEVVFDNRCEAFNLSEPVNGEAGLSSTVTLRWETNIGGVKSSSVYISEYPDMAYAKRYDCTDNSITVKLDYGKKYYWCVINKPFLDYDSRRNSNGIFEFSTMSLEDRYNSLKYSIKFLKDTADSIEYENIEAFKKQADEFYNITDLEEAIAFGENAINELLSSSRTVSETDTDIYDDYSNDIIGEKPFGLFQRSTGILDIKTAYIPESENKGVKFNDTGVDCHYAARYFYPEDKLVEFSTRVIPMQNDGQFSMSLIKTGYHATKDGVSGGNAARVIFDSDGMIYGDKNKSYPLVSYYANNNYDVKIVLDIRKQSYDVYINGEKKAENIELNCTGVTSVGSILYDTSDATVLGKSSMGVFYIDNTIVKTARDYGIGSYLTSLCINGKYRELNKPVIETGLSENEILNAEIEYETSKNARTDFTYDSGAFYVTVLSGNGEKISTYIIK